jgi:predicted DNA-binding transcriptional regulator YafY
VTRRLHPLGLVLKAGVWYLVAAGPQPRTYRVGNIEELRALDEHFTRPAGFDLAEFWRAHVERYEDGEQGETALVRFSPAGIAALPDVLGPRAARLVARTLSPADAEGWQHAEIPLESVAHAAAGLLRLGADAQVLAPAELVAHMGTTIRAMARLYP